MLLRVQYNTGRYDLVKDVLLDRLIASGKILRFYRSTGWVFTGHDLVRAEGGSYDGTERRRGKEAAAA